MPMIRWLAAATNQLKPGGCRYVSSTSGFTESLLELRQRVVLSWLEIGPGFVAAINPVSRLFVAERDETDCTGEEKHFHHMQ
jgi:hypothetical protein